MRNWKRKTRYAKKSLLKRSTKCFQFILAGSETEVFKTIDQLCPSPSSVIFDLERCKDDPYIMRIESLIVDGIDRSDILERCYEKG